MNQENIVLPELEPIKEKPVTVLRYAWVILFVVFLASVAAPLNQFKVPPLMPVLTEVLQLNLIDKSN